MATETYQPDDLPDYKPMLPRDLHVGDVLLLPEMVGPFPAVKTFRIRKINKIRPWGGKAVKYQLYFDGMRNAVVDPKDTMKVMVQS